MPGGGTAVFEPGVVGDVDRLSVRFALTDDRGQMRAETIHSFDADAQPTLSGALSSYVRQMNLPALPSRCALAVAGAARGDTISVTHSRWFISRSGLAAMLRAQPIVMNDMAACAWALSAADARQFEPLASQPARPPAGTGTFCVIGVGAGLGVAAFVRDEQGHVTVLSTEAGHAPLAPACHDDIAVLDRLRGAEPLLTAETAISARGLLAIYRMEAGQGGDTAATNPEDVARLAASGHVPARRAVDIFARLLCQYAGNLALGLGAWDGVYLTGQVVHLLQRAIGQALAQGRFVLHGPHQRALRAIPLALVTLDNGPLRGAAQALCGRDLRLA